MGAAAIFARFALTGAGPVAVSMLRLAIAAAVVLALVAVRGPRRLLSGRNEAVLALAGVVLAVHFATWIASLRFTSIAIATLLVCTSPIFTGIGDAFSRRRAPGAFFWSALAFAAVGLALVAQTRNAPAPIPGFGFAGAALAVAGALAMAVYLTIVRTIRADLATLTIVVRTYAWAALALVPVVVLLHEAPPPWTPGYAPAWMGIAAMALVSQLLGHTGMNSALRFFTPTTVGFSTLLEPPIAGVLGALIFGEHLTAMTLAGGVLILAAIGFALRDAMSAAAEPQL